MKHICDLCPGLVNGLYILCLFAEAYNAEMCFCRLAWDTTEVSYRLEDRCVAATPQVAAAETPCRELLLDRVVLCIQMVPVLMICQLSRLGANKRIPPF